MVSKENSEKIQELQILEHNLQALIAQKQAIQMELNEVLNALEEVKKTNDEVYKVISGVMLKSSQAVIVKELEEKKNLFELRISSVEKQEKIIESLIEATKKELTSSLDKKKKD